MPGLKDFTSAQLNALLGLFKRVRPRQGEVIEAENASVIIYTLSKKAALLFNKILWVMKRQNDK